MTKTIFSSLKKKEPGRYNAEIDLEYLEIGAKFKLSIETPDKQVYESAYEEIIR